MEIRTFVPHFLSIFLVFVLRAGPYLRRIRRCQVNQAVSSTRAVSCVGVSVGRRYRSLYILYKRWFVLRGVRGLSL